MSRLNQFQIDEHEYRRPEPVQLKYKLTGLDQKEKKGGARAALWDKRAGGRGFVMTDELKRGFTS